MKHASFTPLIALTALALLGAGCGKNDGQTAGYSQLKTDIPIAQASTPTSAPAADAAPTNPTTTTAMSDEKLAFPGVLPEAETANKIVRVKTTKGEIVFELLPKEGPKAVSNFVYLAKKKFYDGLIFHRKEAWVLQGGDPTGTGFSGPGYQFEDDKVNLPYAKGIVAMANSGANTNGSQFFIMLIDTPLQPDYSILGRVISGQNVAEQLAVGDKMTAVTIEDKK